MANDKLEREAQRAGFADTTVILAIDILQTVLDDCDENQAANELQSALARWHREQGFQEARARGHGAPPDRIDGKMRDAELEVAHELASRYIARIDEECGADDPHSDATKTSRKKGGK